MVWPAVIAGASAIAGGIMNQFSQSAARDDAAAHNAAQVAMQREFATTGLQWRAGDAIKAYQATGIHPLALLGVQTPSYTPTNFVGSGTSPMGDAIASAGQGVSRAMMASASEETRNAMTKPLIALQLERGVLENDLLRLRIASENARLVQERQPAMPTGNTLIPGQGNTDKSALPGAAHVEKGVQPTIGFARVADGGLAVIPAKGFQERTEDYSYMPLMWVMRELAVPHVTAAKYPPPASVEPLKPYHKWSFGYDGVWRQVVDPGLKEAYPDRHMMNRVAPGVMIPRGLSNSGYGTYRR